MRPAAHFLARVAGANSSGVQAPGVVMAEGIALEELSARLEAQIQTVEALVAATQDQVRALICLKTTAVGDTESMTRLATVQATISQLSSQLGADSDNVREAARNTQRTFTLGDSELPLTELALRLPLPYRRTLEERVTDLKSLAQALSELQRIAQIHAHRGLQAVAAWRTVLGVPHAEAGTTYSRTGRTRVRPATRPTSIDLDL